MVTGELLGGCSIPPPNGRKDAAMIDDVTLTRFWSKVDRRASDECWPWLGASGQSGHGQFFFEGRVQPAARAAWLMFNGPLNSNIHVCHRCDNPPCVNLNHLFTGTHADNMRDMRQKGRMVMPKSQGVHNSSAVLTEKQVLEIRESQEMGIVLARIYNVSRSTISEIRLRKTWAHLA